MSKYSQHVSTRKTHQQQAIPGRKSEMVKNSAGGFTFQVDPWVMLDRFCILGTEGGSYYISEHKLTRDAATNVVNLIKTDGSLVIKRLLEIDAENRAPKKDAIIFVLALATCPDIASEETRQQALSAMQRICRTGSDLFLFANNVKEMRGWGRALRNAIATWYTQKSPEDLAYQVIKYRQRHGFTHRDLLRLSHPRTHNSQTNDIFNFLTQGNLVSTLPDQITAFVRAQSAQTDKELIDDISNYNLTWEMIPTEFQKNKDVWSALLPQMPLRALLRNLGRLTSIELLAPGSSVTKLVVEKISNTEVLKKARIHPIHVISALKTYSSGCGLRGNMSWKPQQKIVDALNDAFYASFKHVVPTGKRFLLGLDVSGSMGMYTCAGLQTLRCSEGAAIMSMVTARTEKDYEIMGFANSFRHLNVSPQQRLDTVMANISRQTFGATDCALPMIWAEQNNVPIDVFCVYTDNQTWSGHIHPIQALRRYRDKTGIPAKLVVVGMMGNSFTIADPQDPGMMDVVGFDTNVPAIISDFARYPWRSA